MEHDPGQCQTFLMMQSNLSLRSVLEQEKEEIMNRWVCIHMVIMCRIITFGGVWCKMGADI